MLDSIHQIYLYKLRTKKLSKILPITIIIIFILPFATAQEFNPIEQAQGLIDSGQAEEAIKLLRPLQPQFEGVPAFDYVFGIACIDTGRNVEAIFALERVVDNLPEHGPARAELAKAYLALGETD
ncbi:MAG: tetratricopeptide repeat protein, partial [Pseudomonadota bacterium]|nr:tetratricopeptide repeat protein [Pseudomonadota bacterium]